MASYRHIVARVLGVALLAAACQTTGPRRPVADDGWGPTAHGPVANRARPPAPRQRLLPESERRAWVAEGLVLLPGRGPSEHLDGSLERTVQINDAAAAYATLTGRRPLPVGALIVQRHHPPGGVDVVTSFVALRERAGGRERWTYLVIDDQQRISASGQLELCARCHADAPHDGLFGPPTAEMGTVVETGG